ncbi:hypothetical protein NA57DRAFT_60085 [Rhizodiscina lignyota]|uniref:Pentatricopeptide repeat protein n=1 Tax=Rhizodiscina lignyota TaxID=1504668 RepID=A0A9P4M2H7_9PEZI|nr:hypothetical protein NA57DRAFT_60085 [Rhizodiscina lignyota]
MQTVWSRVAQAKCTCKCPSCVFRRAADARRSVATTRRLFLKPLQSATFTYSAIFAGACVIDSSIKDRRRNELDTALANARKELEEVEARTVKDQEQRDDKKRRLPAAEEVLSIAPRAEDQRIVAVTAWSEELLPWTPSPSNDGLQRGSIISQILDGRASNAIEGERLRAEESVDEITGDASDEEVGTDSASQEQLSSTQAQWDDERGSIPWENIARYDVEGEDKPRWPKNLGPKIDTQYLPPQSLWAPKQSKQAAAETPWASPRKVRTTEIVTEWLALELFRQADIYYGGRPVEGLPSSIRALTQIDPSQLQRTCEQFFEAIWNLNKQPKTKWNSYYSILQSKPFWQDLPVRVKFEMDDTESFVEGRKRLNAALFNIFISSARNELSNAELVANVSHELLTTTSPPDYQTFNILLVGFTKSGNHEAVAKVLTAQEQAHNRPNETTCVAILNHLTARNDIAGFTKFVDKMRGHHNGIMLARPDITVTESNAKRLLVSPHSEQRKVIQKVHPTPMVYKAILEGVLKFGGFHVAVNVCNEMNADGWGLDRGTLGVLLRACTRKRDWDNGFKLWQRMLSLDSASRSRNKEEAMNCAEMLTLCLLCDKQSHFKSVFGEAVHLGYNGQVLKEMVKNSPLIRRRRIGMIQLDNLAGLPRGRVEQDKQSQPRDFSIKFVRQPRDRAVAQRKQPQLAMTDRDGAMDQPDPISTNASVQSPQQNKEFEQSPLELRDWDSTRLLELEVSSSSASVNESPQGSGLGDNEDDWGIASYSQVLLHRGSESPEALKRPPKMKAAAV